MSPGCAATVLTPDGDAVFVKAVGPELNGQTPELFRREATLLAVLDDVPYRPRLLATYDVGEWVALVLSAVAGRYPDLSMTADVDATARCSSPSAPS